MSSNKNKVLIVGYFGKKCQIQEGQSIKTRNISRLLNELNCEVNEFDTESFRYDFFAPFKLIGKLFGCKKVCLLPAYNNLRIIFPILYVFSLFFRYDIYLFTIGGRLHIYLQSLPIHKWMIKRIKCVFHETQLLGSYLGEMHGLTNLKYCPNFKFTHHIPQRHHTEGFLYLVFLARITPEKGVDTIFNYASYLKRLNRDNIIIDFYGMIDTSYKEYFESELNNYSFITYKGIANQDDIPMILEQYDAMLFPTHCQTEGIPGSVLDAYISGIPVIASDWMYARELIEDGKTGILVPFENNDVYFIDACESLLNDTKRLCLMKEYAQKRSEQYHANNVKAIIEPYFTS